MELINELALLIGAIPAGVPYVALITFAIWAIYKGHFTPKHLVDERIADKDAELKRLNEDRIDEIKRLREDRDDRYIELISERDSWRKAYEEVSRVLESTSDVNRDLLETGRTMRHVLNSLPNVESQDAQVVMPTTEGGKDGD